MSKDNDASPLAMNRAAIARMTVVAWTAAIALSLFLCVWPFVGGMVAANDDLKFLRSQEYAGSFADDLRYGWGEAANFRPLENLIAAAADARTLACPLAPPSQCLGLLAFFSGAAIAARRIFPGHPLAPPLMLIVLALSPATSVSLWQMDTCSQTFVAAAGIWAGLLAWNAIDAVAAGRIMWRSLLALTVLCTIAMNVKEMFYGWSAGLGLALAGAIIVRLRSRRAAMLRAALVLIPIVLLPAAHLLYRLRFAGMAAVAQARESASADPVALESARYQVELGSNILANAWLSALGLFANGPLHLVNDDAAPMLLRLTPILSLVAMFIVLASAAALMLLHRRAIAGAHLGALLAAVVACVLSLSVTLPMPTVSELYGMGANAGAAMLVIYALIALWRPANIQEQPLTRAIAIGSGTIILIIGAYGLASRAYHFNLTWRYARDLNRMVLRQQAALPPQNESDDPRRPSMIYFARPCFSGHFYNQYVVSPLQALGLDHSMPWMNRVDAQRRVRFALDKPLAPVRPPDVVVECDHFPVRRHW